MNHKRPVPLADEIVVQHLLHGTRQQDTLGDLVIFGASGLEIAPDLLRGLLRHRGIEKWAPVDIKPRVAARKAINLFRPALETGQYKVMVRKAHEDDDEVHYALVAEGKVRKTRDLAHGTLNKIILHKHTGELSYSHARVEAIDKLYAHLCSVYTNREVMTLAQNVLTSFGGVKIKAAGQLWFAPRAARSIVDGLRDLFNVDLPHFGKAHFRPLGILTSGDARAVLGDALQEGINADMGEAAENLRSVMREKKPKPATLEHAIKKVREIKGKAALYEGLVEVDLAWIEEAVDLASRKLTERTLLRQNLALRAEL